MHKIASWRNHYPGQNVHRHLLLLRNAELGNIIMALNPVRERGKTLYLLIEVHATIKKYSCQKQTKKPTHTFKSDQASLALTGYTGAMECAKLHSRMSPKSPDCTESTWEKQPRFLNKQLQGGKKRNWGWTYRLNRTSKTQQTIAMYGSYLNFYLNKLQFIYVHIHMYIFAHTWIIVYIHTLIYRGLFFLQNTLMMFLWL